MIEKPRLRWAIARPPSRQSVASSRSQWSSQRPGRRADEVLGAAWGVVVTPTPGGVVRVGTDLGLLRGPDGSGAYRRRLPGSWSAGERGPLTVRSSLYTATRCVL